MTVTSTVRLAQSALLRNKMRSLLTTLGIVIGVGAVVIMQSIGQGATAYISDQISGLGSNMLIVVPGTTRMMGVQSAGVPLFTVMDMETLRRRAHSVLHIAPMCSRRLRTVYGSNSHNTTVNGTTSAFFQIRKLVVTSGRNLNEDDERTGALVCVLGSTVRDALFGSQDPIGKEIRVHNLPMRVIGILESRGSTMGMDADDVAYTPFTTFSRRISGNDRITAIMFSAVSQDQIDDAKLEATQIFRQRRHILPGEDDDFVVRDPREMASLLETVTGVLTILLSSIAAISLLVGGIGIMNIMLVSVTERTREIGLRLAVGATSSDILTQFLVEATILAGLGGLIGLLLGLAGSSVAASAISIPFVVPIAAIPIAFGVSVLIGIIFGVAPARKASRLVPLDALRFE
jgi:putative ABC transport system permease protein